MTSQWVQFFRNKEECLHLSYPPSGKDEFKVYVHKEKDCPICKGVGYIRGNWHWHLKSRNGRVMCGDQEPNGFVSLSNAKRSFNRARTLLKLGAFSVRISYK